MSPPSGQEPFLRAICESPDDDAPRLVFADWLEETGDPDRAEFVRKQVHLARNPHDTTAGRRCAELFRANGRAWVSQLPGTADLWAELPDLFGRGPALRGQTDDDETGSDIGPAIKDWERGFPTAVYVRGAGDRLFALAGAIAAFVPVRRLNVLYVQDADGFIRTLAGLPLMKHLRDLILPFGMPSDDAAVALAESPFAARLRYISLEAGRLTDRAARALAASPYLEHVEVFHLLHTQWEDSARTMLRARFGYRVHC